MERYNNIFIEWQREFSTELDDLCKNATDKEYSISEQFFCIFADALVRALGRATLKESEHEAEKIINNEELLYPEEWEMVRADVMECDFIE